MADNKIEIKKPFENNAGLFFRVLGYPEGVEIEEDIKQMFSAISEEAFELAEPVALHKVFRNEQRAFLELENLAYICYALVSIGEKISRRITEYMNEGSYLKGMCLDAMADEIIYKLVQSQCEALKAEFESKNMGTTELLTPGEQLPLFYQTEIVKKLGAASRGIGTTAAHMINPVKSSTFILGVDENLPVRDISHNCDICPRKDCRWRSPLRA